MGIGDIVCIKCCKSIVGQVVSIDDMDRVTITMVGTGTVIKIDMVDLEVVERSKFNRGEE